MICKRAWAYARLLYIHGCVRSARLRRDLGVMRSSNAFAFIAYSVAVCQMKGEFLHPLRHDRPQRVDLEWSKVVCGYAGFRHWESVDDAKESPAVMRRT